MSEIVLKRREHTCMCGGPCGAVLQSELAARIQLSNQWAEAATNANMSITMLNDKLLNMSKELAEMKAKFEAARSIAIERCRCVTKTFCDDGFREEIAARLKEGTINA